MNITFSVDEQVVERAREQAEMRGKSLNQWMRESLAELAGLSNLEKEIEAFKARAGQGNSGGWKFNREEIYEERLSRYSR